MRVASRLYEADTVKISLPRRRSPAYHHAGALQIAEFLQRNGKQTRNVVSYQLVCCCRGAFRRAVRIWSTLVLRLKHHPLTEIPCQSTPRTKAHLKNR